MNDKILDKLRKLINHQRSAEKLGSIHEAKLFAEKIQEFLDQYNLSMSDIDMSQPEQNTVDKEDLFKSFKEKWKQVLCNSIAKVNSCRAIYCNPNILIIGAQADREIVAELYDYFSSLGEHLAQIGKDNTRKECGVVQPGFRMSFLWGYATTLGSRMIQMHEESLKKAPQTSTALVHIGNKIAKADAFVQQKMRTKDKKLSGSVISNDAYEQGKEAGKKVTLTNKVFEK